ncbi:Kinesin-like protein Nod [Lucilia cuprina]|uniref:Kinesin-like protein Nod n=1 Tax=Lucilia cuprina TaxID=7375 RepID=A0A0L0BW04_LUCCU|nr:Kinesin-like protein Nod [Lucilia cuprina]
MNNIGDNSAVKIAVRERPARENLKNNLQSSVITYHPNGNNIIVNEAVFTFDHVLGPAVTQKEIFDSLIKPLVVNLKLGFNCTALAYGQTGTGKSYTMGLDSKSFDGEDVGVIPRCLKEIFSSADLISESEENEQIVNNSSTKMEILASFIEIYNEKVYDLLGENTNEPIIAKGYKYTGGTRKPLNNIDDCYTILMQGNKNRHVRPTKMNSQSSRSHAIFTIHVRSRTQKDSGGESITTSCMNIVDLAGSEGVRRTGHQGVAMSEGVHINQGLLSIGKVLQAMTTGSKVIPYRDSVLSSVLQESLNSNSYLTLLACISPHREDLSETLSTLRFAQNAKQLKNTPEINNIIADIKKNAKLKQTPYKSKPLQINNPKVTPLKRSYSTLYGTQVKSSIKSNTFCTPKKQRVEVNKCNQTEISSNYKKPKLSNVEMNLPKMGQLESTHNRESMFNRSLESNGSLLSLNISTSTAVDGHTYKRNTNFSPIIRKCIAELKNDLEDNLMKMIQKNLQTLVPQTPAHAPAPAPTPQNQTNLPSTIRQELKNIMMEVLSEKDSHISPMKTNAKCQLFNNSDDLFKIPEIPSEIHRPKTSSPITNSNDSLEPSTFTQTFFAGATNSDKTVLNKSIRRSIRISARHHEEQSFIENNTSEENASQLLRRSSRKSVLKIYQDKRRSIRLVTHNEKITTEDKPEKEKVSKTVKKLNKSSKGNAINNTIIDGYCNGSTSSNTKTSLTKHRKAILDLLNRGSMKELQILPQVGQKTAYQIVTQRTLNGKFRSVAQVEKLPIWRGNAWERFAQANMLI